MNVGIILLLVVTCALVLGLCAALSFYLNKRAQKSGDSGTWANAKTPLLVVVGTTFATAFGGGTLTAHVGMAYTYGWSLMWYEFAQGFGIFSVVLLVHYLHKHGFSTLPEIFNNLYGDSKKMTALISLCAIVTPFGWIASQCVAFGKIFAPMTGVSITVLTVAFAIVVLIFVLPNGFSTVAWSDAIFGFCIVACSIALVVTTLGTAGGWSEVYAANPQLTGFTSSLTIAGPSLITYWFLSLYPGQLVNQMYIQRVAAAESSKKAYQSFAIAGLMVLSVGIFATLLGRSIYALNPEIGAEDAFGWLLTQLPTGLVAMVMGLVGASIMSTADSAVQSAVVNVVYNIYKTIINPEATERKLVRLSRISSVIVIALAVLVGLQFPSVLDLLTVSYSYAVAMMLVPMYCGYLMRKKQFNTPVGCVCGIVGGILGCLYGQFLYVGWIPFTIFGIAGSLITWLIGNAVSCKKHYMRMLENKEDAV